jgi:dTMP kinase
MNLKPGSNRGNFIVIEGGDSVGKNTQAKLMLKHLQRNGLTVELLSFPQYDSPFGSLVAKYLRGEYGSLSEVPPEIPCLLYALDRYQFKDDIENGLRSGKWYLADRYTQSNLAHQGAKLSGQARKDLLTWIQNVEHRLPQPDLVIYLHVPVKLSQELMNNRKHKDYLGIDKTQDIHEQDQEYQQAVVDMYLELASEFENWVVVECVDDVNNKLLGIEIIHHRIAKKIEQKLGIPAHH